MAHTILSVIPLEDFNLLVTFKNGIEKTYDLKQLYPILPQFKYLEKDLFSKVKTDVGGYGISWNDDLDLDAEEIWESGIVVGQNTDVDISNILGANLSEIREQAGITQKELSNITGIYQADISKIERGIGNPSLKTLKRLADGLNATLKIEYTLLKK